VLPPPPSPDDDDDDKDKLPSRFLLLRRPPTPTPRSAVVVVGPAVGDSSTTVLQEQKEEDRMVDLQPWKESWLTFVSQSELLDYFLSSRQKSRFVLDPIYFWIGTSSAVLFYPVVFFALPRLSRTSHEGDIFSAS
jgi:hypothetical protein